MVTSTASRSSRRLEAETHRNIEVIWLLRHLKPDFKTIADFRSDNRRAFRLVFRQFVLLCGSWTCLAASCWPVDGTRIKAVNNKDRNFTRASLTEFIKLADKKLEDYLQRLDTSDVAEQEIRRFAGQEPGGEDPQQFASVAHDARRCWQSSIGPREPDLADRSGQSGNGGSHACCGRLQRSGCGGHQAIS